MKLLVWIAGLAAALLLVPTAGAGGQTYLSWTIGDDAGKPTISWKITGSTPWYVGVIQIATRQAVTDEGDFLPEDVVAYDVLTHGRHKGTWQLSFPVAPGTYYGMLTLRYDGPCETGCESRSSVRSFFVEPPRLAGLAWSALANSSRIAVRWKKPGKGWYVGIVLVDNDRDFSSPEAAGTRSATPAAGRWRSRALEPGTYYVRLRARYTGCDTCLWTSRTKKVQIA